MNVYWIDAGDHDEYQETIADCHRYEVVRVCDIVIAPTRGKARAVFVDANSDAYIEFCDSMSIRKIGSVSDDLRPQTVREQHTDLGRAVWAMMPGYLDYLLEVDEIVV